MEVTVINRGKGGILGLGSEEAMVRVSLHHSVGERENDLEDSAEEVKGIVETLLSLMEVDGVVEIEQPSDEVAQTVAPINLNIRGEDLGILIGRQGRTLSSLQHITRLIAAHQLKARIPVTIDVEGYSRHRREALRRLALHLADQVMEAGRLVTLEPMPAAERRIIHVALADYPGVVTQSTGEREARKVVIMPDHASE